MNKLSKEKRSQVIRCLVEGNSLRSTVRMTGVSMMTVLRLLRDIGEVCLQYQDEHFRNLNCRRIQVDEIWSFCYSKEKNVPEDKKGKFGFGDVWTWVALDVDSKLVPSWLIADRGAAEAEDFMTDLASRLANRVQLTSDGHNVYLTAVESAFGGDIDYSMLVKIYGRSAESETRYSPVECIGCRKEKTIGHPDPLAVSTSFVERQNLTMRMSMRRFTRLTNAFSKKVENHAAAIALHYMHYNYCRVHKTLRVTPAMEAGLTDHVWDVEEIVARLEEKESN